MKAITLHEPWASLVAHGLKRYETRSWGTKYRGPLAIHAGKTWGTAEQIQTMFNWPYGDILGRRNLTETLGHVLAVGELAACFEITQAFHDDLQECYDRFGDDDLLRDGNIMDLEFAFGDFTPGRYAWQIELMQRLDKPVKARGYQGAWEWVS